MSETKALPPCPLCGNIPLDGAAVMCRTRNCELENKSFLRATWRRLAAPLAPEIVAVLSLPGNRFASVLLPRDVTTAEIARIKAMLDTLPLDATPPRGSAPQVDKEPK